MAKFTLGGSATIPLPPARIVRAPVGREIPLSATPEQIARGQTLFTKSCIRCHNPQFAPNSGIVPDLRSSTKETLTVLFSPIVYDGVFAGAKGMPSFKDVLSQDDVESIRSYIVSESKKLAESAP